MTTVDSPLKYKKTQIQLKEKLLCSDCDNKIGGYETYINNLFYDRGARAQHRIYKGQMFLENIDYRKFKLFMMSILWRSAVSRLDFFSEIKLVKKKAERLRRMLDLEDPGDTYEFCTIAVISKLIGKTFPDMIIQPYPVRFLSYKFYYYVMGGIHWLIFPSKMTKLFPLRNHFITKNGKMIVQLVKSEEFGSFKDILNGLKTEGFISFPE